MGARRKSLCFKRQLHDTETIIAEQKIIFRFYRLLQQLIHSLNRYSMITRTGLSIDPFG
jgi:hypothetical protein